MKKILYILITAVSVFTSCENDLIKEPDFISETSVFEQKELTEAYMATLYTLMPFQQLSGQSQNGMGIIAAVGLEHIAFADWQDPNNAYLHTYSEQNGASFLDYWPYATIREINYLLENIVNSSSFDQNYIDAKVAEARFLRAYAYFEMVKRYGGVPLITKVQNQDDPEEELYPKRNTEKEVYDFINNELNAIIPIFSDTKTGANGRVDKYVALALQSRAMLYAASIAKFGEVQIDGVVGIPAGDAQSYYQKSYNASKAIMDSNMFSLYNNLDNKVQNYIQLFINEGNNEVIFSEIFEPIIKGHSLDYLATPQGFNATWNSNFPVLYDFVELYEFMDGRSGTSISRDQLTQGNSWDINDFFGNRDPRFRASVFYPEYEWQGKKVYFHTNTTYTDENGNQITTNSGTLNRNGEEWPAAAPPRNVRNTSLLLRKRLDESNTGPISGNSGQDFYVFRYAETLLNYAEAAYYLGKPNEALTAINIIRNRAGMPLKTEATEDNIRLERQVELAFEEHRFWDLIRWRIGQDAIDGVRTQGLTFKYNLDNDLYTITLKNAEPRPRSFGPERNYLPISLSRRNDNPNLVQNPGY